MSSQNCRSLVPRLLSSFLFHLVLAHSRWTRSLDPLHIAFRVRVIELRHIDLILDYLVLLISISSHHHVGLLRSSAVNDDIVITLFDHSDCARLVPDHLSFARLSVVVVLRGKDSSTHDLWVINFDLWVVEDEVVTIDVFDDFDWLLLTLLFGLR